MSVSIKNLSVRRKVALLVILGLVVLPTAWGLRILGKGALFQNLERTHLENLTRIETTLLVSNQATHVSDGAAKNILYPWIRGNMEIAARADSEVFPIEQRIFALAGYEDIYLLPRQGIVSEQRILDALHADPNERLTPDLAKRIQAEVDFLYTISRQFVVQLAAALAFIKNAILVIGVLGLGAGIAIERTGREKELKEQRKRLEDKVEQRTSELVRSNHKLSQALHTLTATQKEMVRRDKLAGLGALVSGVAHELNTPIGNGLISATAMADKTNNFARSVEQGIRRSDLHDYLQQVQTGSDLLVSSLTRCAALVDRFKHIAGEQTQRTQANFDLVELLHDQRLPAQAPEGIRLSLDVPTALGMQSYPSTLDEVLSQLINNAVVHGYAGRETGTVWLRARTLDGNGVELTVEDMGGGIAAEDLPRIFDPFFSRRMGTGGSGLGLYIVYNLVTDILGGDILAYSPPGGPTRLVLTLPRQAPDAQEPVSIAQLS